jgi:flagellar biogenesis protein FliO
MTPSCPKSRSIRNLAARALAIAALLPRIALAAQPAVTQAASAQPTTSVLGEVLAIVLPLLFIIGALVAVLIFARRRFGLTGQDAPLSIVQILPVGPRERIVLVRTRAGRVMAVGVAAHSLTLLARLEHDDVHAQGNDATTNSSPADA